MDKRTTTLLHLNLIPELGPVSIERLLLYAHRQLAPDLPSTAGWHELLAVGDLLPLEYIFELDAAAIARITRLNEANAAAVAQQLKSTSALVEETALIQKHAVTILTPFDPAYPVCLREIHHPPPVLYCQGAALTSADQRLAIVGARKAGAYAQQVINHIIPPVVGQGWQVVSGGALGADTMAHEAALAAGGVTIAVLGSGLLEPYPAANISLFARIAGSGGTVVSSFPLRMPPDRTTFPMRNRIIAGLSAGTMVVQAAERSGALITARYALEQGRTVFAVPGLVTDALSAGCHALIKQGAKLVAQANDILEEFGQVSAEAPIATQAPVHADPLLATLREPVTLDELQLASGLAIDELQDRLFQLQVEGRVRQHVTGTWQLHDNCF